LADKENNQAWNITSLEQDQTFGLDRWKQSQSAITGLIEIGLSNLLTKHLLGVYETTGNGWFF